MLAAQRRECRLLLSHLDSFFVPEWSWGVKLRASLWHQEPLFAGWLRSSRGFHNHDCGAIEEKSLFYGEKPKTEQSVCDKKVAAGKKQSGTLRLPFLQHLKAFLVLDVSHWKSPLSSDALPLGLFFQTLFDATLSTTPKSMSLVFLVLQCTNIWGIIIRKVNRASIFGSKWMYYWWAGLQIAPMNITVISMVWILIVQAVFAVRNDLYLSSGANMGDSAECVSCGHLERVKFSRASPNLEDIRGWDGNGRLTWHMEQYSGYLRTEKVKHGVSCLLRLYIVIGNHNHLKKMWVFLAKCLQCSVEINRVKHQGQSIGSSSANPLMKYPFYIWILTVDE